MKKINDIICRVFKLSADELNFEAGMDEIESWDSLSHMDLITTLEKELGICFSGDDIADMITLEKVRNIASNYLVGK